MKYSVTVKPGTSQEKIVAGPGPAELTIWIRAKAHDGEANSAVVKLLAKHFHIAKSQVVIERGATGRKKIISIG